jgi:hypothetical protein
MIVQPRWETRISSRGIPYQVQQAMPWIEPEFLECTVYMYPSEKEADDGDRIGGSSFIDGPLIDLLDMRRQPIAEVMRRALPPALARPAGFDERRRK